MNRQNRCRATTSPLHIPLMVSPDNAMCASIQTSQFLFAFLNADRYKVDGFWFLYTVALQIFIISLCKAVLTTDSAYWFSN